MKKTIRVCLIQPKIEKNNENNYVIVEKLIKSSLDEEPDIICLPERWYFLDFTKNFSDIIQNQYDEQYQRVKNWSKVFKISIISGGIWEYHNNSEKPFVSSYYFKNGNEMFRQDKIHLYEGEKKILSSGDCLNIYKDPYLNINFSILICFDLHISSFLVNKAINNDCEIIFSPTLIQSTGIDNWTTYIQARALENRIPIVSCNSIFEQFNKQYLGESKIIHFKRGSSSPVKILIEKAKDQSCFFIKEIDLAYSNRIRRKRIEDNIQKNQIKIKIINEKKKGN